MLTHPHQQKKILSLYQNYTAENSMSMFIHLLHMAISLQHFTIQKPQNLSIDVSELDKFIDGGSKIILKFGQLRL